VVTLPATRITPDVAARGGTLRGRVRAIYRAAVYLDLEPSGGLLVLAIDAVGGVPGGILVGGIADLREIGIDRGAELRPSTDGWSIPSAGVEIQAAGARTWSPGLPDAARPTATPELRFSLELAREIAAHRAPVGGLAPLLVAGAGQDDPWLAVARSLVRRQLDALDGGDVASAVDPTLELIGLGTGLTPSGDDYLVGLLAALEATADPVHSSLATAIADGLPGRTTAVGEALIGHAVRGEFSERLHEVLIALAGGRPRDLARPIERAMAYGATSGSDTLVGLFAGLEIALARQTGDAEAAA
jgi:hypothetical protein